jgi:hypothetical protein
MESVQQRGGNTSISEYLLVDQNLGIPLVPILMMGLELQHPQTSP